ncbi:pyridoxine 5'-phosphate synthase [Pelagibacterales bacterium SAG-MED39]|nr:pyridoxine 5'-phosphate synthase [Pelagibacterales bacterium SAG-MED39]
MKRLGVNIDHVATIRNARGEKHPSPFLAAKFAKKAGADSITIHLREDRRHIKDLDAKKICSIKGLLVNLEISTNLNMIKSAIKLRPDFVCIVPENRKEITTEGGLNLRKNKRRLKQILSRFKKEKIRTSLFINPIIDDIRISKELETNCIEIHTGHLANLIKSKKNYTKELKKITKCSILAKNLGIEVHAGHGLDYKTTRILRNIKEIEEYNIGHYIIGESIFSGLSKVIKNFNKIIKNRK